MPRFVYTARDSSGRNVSGEVVAANAREAAFELEARDLQVETVEPLEQAADTEPGGRTEQPVEQLKRREFDRVSRHIAELTEAELPLATGLSHLADELPKGKFRRALSDMAAQLDQGHDLESVIESHGAPADLRALVRAGARSGRTAEVLWQYVAHTRNVADVGRRAVLALAYPLLTATCAALVVLFLLTWIVPDFRKIFLDFDTELPGITNLLIEFSNLFVERGLWVALAVVVAGMGTWTILKLALGEVARRRCICAIPFLGPLLRWAALSRFSHLLAVLIENDVPLPDALQLAGQGSADAQIRDASCQLAETVEAGGQLAPVARALDDFPTVLVEMLRREQNRESLTEAIHSIGEMFEGRVRSQASFITVACEPVLVVSLGFTVGFIVIALFMPLVRLLNDLS